ncbi:MAG: helix-turn-helix domain-containing protein [Candidatus Woesearchaeota archaeon]|jgi:predicted transcriptional regulator|nr:helix-turn-helix domain-containing protein [Candidatus Woesearchaeota archaeon]
MKLPQEIMHWEIIPAIRNNLVRELKELGLNQEKIAKIMDITPAAVSQYTSGKRGKSFEFCDDFINDINKSARRLFDKKNTIFYELNTLSASFKEKKYLCPICKKENNLEVCNLEK